MQEFHYVNEYDLTQMNVIERVLHLVSNHGMTKISFMIFGLILAFAIITWILKRPIIRHLALSKDSLDRFIVYGIGIPIMILSLQGYLVNSHFNYIGHYEAKGEVVGFENNSREHDDSVLIKLSDNKAPIEADIVNDQSFNKGDKVIVKTKTMNFEKRPLKKIHNINLALIGEKAVAVKQ